MKNTVYIMLFAVGMLSAFAFKAIDKKVYTVDTEKTKCSWVGTKVTGKHEGNINIAKGSVGYDGKSITDGTIEFDMTSMTCTDLADKEWNDKLIGHLKSEDFFGVEKFPTATFKIKSVVKGADNNYTVTGDLTIKGITHETSFPAAINIADKTIVTVATITVNRTLYDIKYGSASFFDGIGDKAISDNFELKVQVVAKTE